MTHFARRRLGAALVLVGLMLGAPSALAQEAGSIRVLSLDGMINPVSERYLVRNIEEAADQGATLVLIELSTPGGLLDATQHITSAMLGARVPVAVYVTPPGTHAASAGTFVTMAAHIAAMAPSTRIGAATPVNAEGGDIPADLREKIINDTVVYARAIADARGRNADWAEDAVRAAAVVPADEAAEIGVVDLVARDRAELLAEIDGRTVALPAGEVTIQTAGAPLDERPMSIFEALFMAIADPNIALLLLSLGGIGIYFELANPGAFLPGIAGAIFLILAFLSLGTLPLSYGGLALLLFGLVLLGAEVFVASGGLLGLGGTVAFALGALLLIDEQQAPFLEVSRPLIAGLTLSLGGFTLIALRGVMQVRRKPAVIGGSDMAGRVARVRAPHEVYVSGELWRARRVEGDAPLTPGSAVRVVSRQGLELTVEPIETDDAPGSREPAVPDRGSPDPPPTP